MIEQELQKLTAAVEKLTAELMEKRGVNFADAAKQPQQEATQLDPGAAGIGGMDTATVEAQGAKAEQATTTQAPEADSNAVYSQEDVVKRLLEVGKAKGRSGIEGILSQFNASTAGQLQPDQFPAVMAAVDKALQE